MRNQIQSRTANCPAIDLKNRVRRSDWGLGTDITRLYLEIRLGARLLLRHWLGGQLRHLLLMRMPAQVVLPLMKTIRATEHGGAPHQHHGFDFSNR